MAKFLFTVWPFPGCLHPPIAVACQLKKRGHECAFYTGARYRSLIEQQGFEHFPFDPAADKALDDLVYSPQGIGKNWSWTRPWRLQPQLRAFFFDGIPQQVTDIRRILSNWGGDVIVSDPALLGTFLILAETEPVPVALCSYVDGCCLPGPDAPPLGLGLPLPHGMFGRLRNRLVGLAQDRFMSSMRRGASRLRQQYGLPPLEGPVIGLAARLPLYLLPSCPEYDYQRRDLPACVRYVGPMQWYPPQDRPGWLDDLPPGQPVVHVTEGTLHYHEAFVLQAAVRGLADAPIQVVITTGGNRELSELGLGALPPNVRVERFVSHNYLLPRTDVLVTTSGGGSTMAGLYHGVPMVMVPTEWDQAENAQRVVECGAGIRLPARKCTPHGLREAIERVMSVPSYLDNAQRLSRILKGYGGAAHAATLLEEIVPARVSETESSETVCETE